MSIRMNVKKTLMNTRCIYVKFNIEYVKVLRIHLNDLKTTYNHLR